MGLAVAVSFKDTVGPLQRAHTHEGSQLSGRSTADFRLEWTHAFGTMCIEVKAGVVWVNGEQVQTFDKSPSAGGVPPLVPQHDRG